MASNIVSADYLRSILNYNADTGVFTRIARTSTSVHVGDVAGSKHGSGYIQISVMGRPYLAHRLAWLYVTGSWPADQIDHLDGRRDNNVFANLRDVTSKVNGQNQRRPRSDNASGFLGVARSRKRWSAHIGVDGQHSCLGHFDTPAEAHAAYIEAKRRLHEGCTI